jgi:hypothetical protein
VVGVAAAVLVAAFNPATSSAAPIACDEAALIAAIETANVNAGPDTIELPAACVYTFTAPYSSVSTSYDQWYGPTALPAIASDITIEGHGAIIERDSSAALFFRLLFVGADPANSNTFGYASPGAGSLTVRDLTLRGGIAKGGNGSGGGAGMGGAIFSQGEVNLARTTLVDNVAQGGNGDASTVGGAGIGGDSVGGAGGGLALQVRSAAAAAAARPAPRAGAGAGAAAAAEVVAVPAPEATSTLAF